MLNDHILFIVIQIVFFVFWLVAFVLTHYHQWVLSDTRHFYDDSLLEASWTTIPGIILYTILAPSLDVLYFFEDPYVPEITVKAVGHPWYWHYELYDIKTCWKNRKSKVSVTVFWRARPVLIWVDFNSN